MTGQAWRLGGVMFRAPLEIHSQPNLPWYFAIVRRSKWRISPIFATFHFCSCLIKPNLSFANQFLEVPLKLHVFKFWVGSLRGRHRVSLLWTDLLEKSYILPKTPMLALTLALVFSGISMNLKPIGLLAEVFVIGFNLWKWSILRQSEGIVLRQSL